MALCSVGIFYSFVTTGWYLWAEDTFIMLQCFCSIDDVWRLVLVFQTIVCAFIIFCWSLMWRFWFHSNWCLRFRELVCYCGYSFWKLLHFGSYGDVKFRSNNLVLDLVCSHCEGWRTYLDYEIYFVALRLYRFCLHLLNLVWWSIEYTYTLVE
jgi:hypothetical protein